MGMMNEQMMSSSKRLPRECPSLVLTAVLGIIATQL
jgi:hypothetical protein